MAWHKQYFHGIVLGFSRDCPGTFLRAPGTFVYAFPFSPHKRATHKHFDPHPFPGQSRRKLLMSCVFSSPDLRAEQRGRSLVFFRGFLQSFCLQKRIKEDQSTARRHVKKQCDQDVPLNEDKCGKTTTTGCKCKCKFGPHTTACNIFTELIPKRYRQISVSNSEELQIGELIGTAPLRGIGIGVGTRLVWHFGP